MDVGFEAGVPVLDARGVAFHPVRSDAIVRPVVVRVLAPEVMPATPRLLLALPVREDHEIWGDGLEVIRAEALHERYGLVVAAPECPRAWAADHPDDPSRREETHLLHGVLPWLRELFPGLVGTMALGFSRTGWAAVSLLLRHPAVVDAAAAFDAPLMKSWPGVHGMQEVFGTPENLDRYRPELRVPSCTEWLAERPRLALYGRHLFGADMEGFRALMSSLGLPFVWSDSPRGHAWTSGWVPEAVADLARMVPVPGQ
jgi:hypothetical protein